MSIRDGIIRKLEECISLETVSDGFFTYQDIDEAKLVVKESLAEILKGNTYSDLFFNQLVELQSKGYVEISKKRFTYHPLNIYKKIEEVVSKQIEYKPFNHSDSLLKGKQIYHVHHGKGIHFEKNQIRYFKQKYKNDKLILRRLCEIIKIYPDKNPLLILINETFDESEELENRTGEWIIFQELNGKYHFICLAVHNYDDDKKDSNLYNIIREYVLTTGST